MFTLCLLVAFRFPPTRQPLLEIPLPGWFYFPSKRSGIPGELGGGLLVAFEEPGSAM